MGSAGRFLAVMAMLAAGGLRPAVADSPRDTLDQNRKWLEKARKDPEHFARLVQDLKAFLNLPPEQRDRLRKLDKELQNLHQKNPAESDRLNRALERYAAWWERLPERDRRWIDEAPNQQQRLQRIRDVRERQWIEHLPKAYRDQIQASQGETRAALIKRFRQEEKHRQQEWVTATRHWDELQRNPPPLRPQDLQSVLKDFYLNVLQPRLSPADIERLKKAEGKWPDYPQTLVELADRYVPFPGPLGPKSMADLPEDVRNQINQRPAFRTRLLKDEGKWPDFAIKIHNLTKGNNKITVPRELSLPSRPGEFEGRVTWFIRNQLLPQLDEEERTDLKAAEGRWPDYPRLVARLAQKHSLLVPGMWPGQRPFWDKYRAQKGLGPVPAAAGDLAP
jgi:hypothetical protein